MNANWTPTSQQRQKRRRKRMLTALLSVFVCIVLAGYLIQSGSSRHDLTETTVFSSEPAEQNTTGVPQVIEPPEVSAPEPDPVISHAIAEGDTLSTIFDQLGIHSAVYQILAADESLLALDVLRPGNILTFTFDQEDNTQLQQMELYIHPGKQVVYERFDEGHFGYEEIIHPDHWEQQLISGEIRGSFYLSAKRTGLSEIETATIGNLLGDVLDFSRALRAGDLFQVVRSQQFVGDEFTGQSRIEGVRIQRGRSEYTAFLFEDGNYYDLNGESLARAFRRYPMANQYRISSSFNPRRKHPISGQVRPHNGVDFAMPRGTPILSTGDGVVTRTMNHPYAGKYVEIQHGSNYLTRYLHLDRILVRRGQTVKRGDRIALSGNTGYSTGPHLHFELHVRGRPVDPLTAQIPMASSLAKDKRPLFEERARELVAVMENGSHRIAGVQTAER